jgi:pyrimidine-nucleoside phosphorylase
MRAVDLIRRKRDGLSLEPDEIRAFIAGVTSGEWPDYQVAALLMAIVWRGMSILEAATLTDAMVRSGARLDLSGFGDAVVDKHSTGGVGDKISLVLAPLAAACGVVVPMMSGRGLGHTGGTLDKLEAIPGFRTRLSIDEIRHALEARRCALVGQTEEIAPADRRLYAMRDVTATVESIPLICASILSKKIAEGARGLVLDVKVGRGAFMKTEADARTLADRLMSIAASNGLPTEAVLSAMDVPLGKNVGNAPEVVEAAETLKGRGPADIEALSLVLTTRMLIVGGLERDPIAAEARVRRALSSGSGLETFRAIIEGQGGDPRVLDDYSRLPQPTASEAAVAHADGLVIAIDAEAVGLAAVALGAGRDRADASVDPSAGIEVHVKPGDRVRRGDRLATVSASDGSRVGQARRLFERAVAIGDEVRTAPLPLVIDVLTAPSPALGSR